MVLSKVFLSDDVYMACLQLALSTEKEEVICLLLGETKDTEDGVMAYIYAIKIPHRLDKKKDRVEISIDQLLAARDHAEKLSHKYKKEIRVLGWFHSHPHITVWPSHVDLNTQANYQTMSDNFVGIISSVFSEDKASKECEINLTCFQSDSIIDDNDVVRNVRRPVPFFIVPSLDAISVPSCLKTISDLPNILYNEEEESYKECTGENADILSTIHNDTLLTKSLLHITNKISIPLLKTLETRERILKQQVRFHKRFAAKIQSLYGVNQEGVQNNKRLQSKACVIRTASKEYHAIEWQCGTRTEADLETPESLVEGIRRAGGDESP